MISNSHATFWFFGAFAYGFLAGVAFNKLVKYFEKRNNTKTIR